MSKSIKTKILVSIILLMSILALAMGGFSVLATYSSTMSVLRNTLPEVSTVASNQISARLEAYINLAKEAGTIKELSNPSISARKKKEILDGKVMHHGFLRHNLIGLDGKSVLTDLDISQRDYFKKAVSGTATVSDPIVSKVTGEIVVMLAAPLWKDGVVNSKIEGIVMYVADGAVLSDIVKTIRVGEKGSAFAIDKTGRTIAHHVDDYVMNQRNNTEEAKKNPQLAQLAAIEQKMTRGESGFGEYLFNGGKRLVFYSPIQGTDGWTVAIVADYAEFMKSARTSVFASIIITLVLMLAGVIVAQLISNGIANPIGQCVQRLQMLAGGDLKSPVPRINTKDETSTLADCLGRLVSSINLIIQDESYLLDQMANGNFEVESMHREIYIDDFSPLISSIDNIRDRLSGTLTQIDQAAGQVSSGSSQVSNGAQALSQGATEQASSVEELAATITEISHQIVNTADNAAQANKKVVTVGGEVAESNTRMQGMLSAMSNISNSSHEIGKIIKAIEDIAFQTNILALNAAVEAARAGAAGKGFAVVADEVRNLASKSAEASKSTAALIEGSLRAVENGTRIANETAVALGLVVQGVSDVAAIIDKISVASNVQSQSIQQITVGIDQISSVVQTNSATAEESAAASEELSSQADLLKNLVSKFILKKKSTSLRTMIKM